jgi:hypothetical protein
MFFDQLFDGKSVSQAMLFDQFLYEKSIKKRLVPDHDMRSFFV